MPVARTSKMNSRESLVRRIRPLPSAGSIFRIFPVYLQYMIQEPLADKDYQFSGQLQFARMGDTLHFVQLEYKTFVPPDVVIYFEIFDLPHILLLGLEMITGVRQQFIQLRADAT